MTLISAEGWLFLMRWFHFLAGIAWIGMLYYFNFVQTPFFATPRRRRSVPAWSPAVWSAERSGGFAGGR